MLTDVAIKKAKPIEKDYKLFDSFGLFILITKIGSKLWRFKYRFNGKEKLLTLGAYPAISLSAARELRDEAKKQIAKGIDPSLLKKKNKLSQAAASQTSLEFISKQWLNLNKDRWTEKHSYLVWRSLERCVFPFIGNVDVQDIDTPLLLGVLQKIEKDGATDTAHRVRQRLEAIFNYTISIGATVHNPAKVIKGALKPTVKNKQPAIINLNELKKLIDTTDRTPAHPLTKLALRFLSLTAVRPNEVRGMRWDEVKDNLWIIPSERMKMRKAHTVPLSIQALDILDVVKKFTGRGGLVFPNSRTIMKPMSENAMGYLLNRAGYKNIHVPHGFRASFSSIMNEKYPNDRNIIDLMLAHAPTNNVEAAYNRAEHMDRRKELSQIWADLLFDGLLSSQELLSLARR